MMFKKLKVFCSLILVWCIMASAIIVNADHSKFVTVAMSTDENYIIPTLLTITSLSKSADPDTNYNIYILYAGDILPESREKLLSLEKKYKNCTINFVNMEKNFENLFVPSSYTKAIFYRLKLPSLLHENRCIYIDVDTIIKKDLSSLFDIDMKECYAAGVRDIVVRQIDDKEYFKKLGFKNPYNYVNSGVLLMNLEKMRKDCIEEKFYNFISEKDKMGFKLNFPDQDTINCVCEDRIFYLPCRYNMIVTIKDMLEAYEGSFGIKDFDETLCFDKKEWDSGLKDPVIIHYAGPLKPWKNLEVQMASIWWSFVDNPELKLDITEKYGLKI